MAIVKFPRKEFEKAVGKIDKKMQEKISMFGTPLESLSDDEIEIEIFPNRPDLYSLQGYLRSFLAFLGKKPGLKSYKVHKPEKNYEVRIDSSVKNIRPYTACSIVKNLNFNDEKIKEIIDIQEKLHLTIGRKRKKLAIGIYPLEHIKLPITFKAEKPEKIKFQPLDFPRELNGRQILQQHPTGREYAHLLKGKEKFPIFIDSAGEILSMPPIINSEKTGKITEKTKDVFIECSGFDFEILKKALNILVTMLADMNGEIYQMKLHYKKKEITPDLKPEKMKISKERINKLLGLNLNDKEIKKLLAKMGHNYIVNKKEVEIPPYRTDIMHEVDLIEDVAIAYGYSNFVPEIPNIPGIGEENKKEIKKRKIAEILVGLDLLEISTLHLLTKSDLTKGKIKNTIGVKESRSDFKFLRPNLLIPALKVLSENVDAEYPQKIFEIGTVFREDKNQESGIKETEHLVIALTPGNFTQLKQVLEYLARMLGIKIKIEEGEKEGFIDGRTGKIIFEEKEIGIIGEVHPSLLKTWHLKMPLACLEMSLEEIFEKI